MTFEVTKGKRQALGLLSEERHAASRLHLTNAVPEHQKKGFLIVSTLIHASAKPVS